MNYIESALEEEIKIVGRYANLQLGVKLFPNGDNTATDLANAPLADSRLASS